MRILPILLLMILPLFLNGQNREYYDCLFNNKDDNGCNYIATSNNADTITNKYFNCINVHLKTITYLNRPGLPPINWGPKIIMNYNGSIYSTGNYYNNKKHGVFITKRRDSLTIIQIYKLDTLKEYIEINSIGDTTDHYKYKSKNKIYLKRGPSALNSDSIIKLKPMPSKPPKFNGNFENYLANNLIYPKKAAKQNICGIIYLRFVITKTGEITNVRIEEGPTNDPILEKAAIEFIKTTNNLWSPAEDNGIAIDMETKLPITFMITESDY